MTANTFYKVKVAYIGEAAAPIESEEIKFKTGVFGPLTTDVITNVEDVGGAGILDPSGTLFSYDPNLDKARMLLPLNDGT